MNENLSHLCYPGNVSLVCRATLTARKLQVYNHMEDKTGTMCIMEGLLLPAPAKSSSNE